MLDRIKDWLGALGASEQPQDDRGHVRRRAAAALLVEAARLDGRYSAVEQERVRGLLAARFGLDAAEAAALAEIGEASQDAAIELFGFIREASDGLVEAERIGLVEMLWEVVYADGALHDFEANLMRRVAGLLHVSDQASGLARRRVIDRLGTGTGRDGAP